MTLPQISLATLLEGRPEKRVYDPPVDPPLNQTEGGVPPYPLPPELVRTLAGKSEAEVSSLLSKFRTGLSQHRTGLSEHRTDLSEHRTDLSDYRTELSNARTEMSQQRTALSNDRSHLSNERTHLSYLRTAISLFSFGITLNRFAVALAQDRNIVGTQEEWELRMRSTEHIGLGMVFVGVGLLVWSLYRYQAVHAQIVNLDFKPPSTSVTILSVAIAIGAITSLILILVK